MTKFALTVAGIVAAAILFPILAVVLAATITGDVIFCLILDLCGHENNGGEAVSPPSDSLSEIL